MLKIKSNTNEFTIIFSEKIGKKINVEKFSVLALSFFQLQRRTFLPFFASAPFFFFFFLPFWPARRLLTFQRLTFLFFRRVALFQPKCWAQNVFQFSPTHFFFSFLFYSQRTFFISVQHPFLLSLVPHFFFSVDVLLF